MSGRQNTAGSNHKPAVMWSFIAGFSLAPIIFFIFKLITGSEGVGVLDRRALNQLVKVYRMPLILDGDAKRHKVYTGLGNRCPTSSLRERSCIPCTEVLVVGVYKQGERGS